MLKKVFKITLISIAGILIITAASLLIYRAVLQSSMEKKLAINTRNGIRSLEKIRLGGVNQWILIRGKNRAKPVLLFLHGGPGSPLFLTAYKRGVRAKLENHFVVVFWEQRGTGKSYSADIPKSSMTVNQFVSDIIELSEMLKKRFKRKKIYILGRSWGSVIGLKAVYKRPELYHAYIGIGQVVNSLQNDTISYRYSLAMARKKKHHKAIMELKQVGLPPYTWKELLKQRKWLRAFGGSTYGHKKEDGMLNLGIIKQALSAPQYTLKDMYNMLMHPFYSVKHLWSQLYKLDFTRQIPEVKVPVYFFTGRHDYMVPHTMTERYFKMLKAPQGKRLIWFEKSAHTPEIAQPGAFNRAIVKYVLKK